MKQLRTFSNFYSSNSCSSCHPAASLAPFAVNLFLINKNSSQNPPDHNMIIIHLVPQFLLLSQHILHKQNVLPELKCHTLDFRALTAHPLAVTRLIIAAGRLNKPHQTPLVTFVKTFHHRRYKVPTIVVNILMQTSKYKELFQQDLLS